MTILVEASYLYKLHWPADLLDLCLHQVQRDLVDPESIFISGTNSSVLICTLYSFLHHNLICAVFPANWRLLCQAKLQKSILCLGKWNPASRSCIIQIHPEYAYIVTFPVYSRHISIIWNFSAALVDAWYSLVIYTIQWCINHVQKNPS